MSTSMKIVVIILASTCGIALEVAVNQVSETSVLLSQAVIAKPILLEDISVQAGAALKVSNYASFATLQNSAEDKTWIAELAVNFNYQSEIFLLSLIGAKVDQSDPNIATTVPTSRLLTTYPLSYDLRSANPGCWSINYIRNQGQCGSCWAVGSATALSDRSCKSSILPIFFLQILPFYSLKRSFSYEDVLECCSASMCGTGPNNGCNGGYINGAYNFAKTTGMVTGENYGNNTNCKNYFLSPSAGSAAAPSCKLYCTTSGYGVTYTNDKRKISGYTVYSSNSIGTAGVASAMMAAIYNRGTVTAYMDVYNDFFTYSNGVYVHSSNAVFKGGHAIRIIGWGYNFILNVGLFKVTLGAYWIGANSWGTGWGINGYFYIRRGTNECNIESYVVEGNL